MGKDVGHFIRKAREKRGLSQSDVARLLNLKTAQSISNIERGVSPLPRSKIKRLAGVLGIGRGELYTLVVGEMQARVARAVGLTTLPREDHELITTLAEKLRRASGSKRAALKKHLQKALDC
jgi:transcriptional regulator with XRE-family HTH domain